MPNVTGPVGRPPLRARGLPAARGRGPGTQPSESQHPRAREVGGWVAVSSLQVAVEGWTLCTSCTSEQRTRGPHF